MTKDWWAIPTEEILEALGAQERGLSSPEALRRRERLQAPTLQRGKFTQEIQLFARQLFNPISFLLLISVGLSFFLGQGIDAVVLLVIVLLSAGLGFWQEYGASQAIAKLIAMVRVEALVVRDNHPIKIPVDQVVSGDLILLSAGAKIPADCRLIEARDLFVSEATLTGETFPVEKKVATLTRESRLAERINIVFLGTHVVSGTAKAIAFAVGEDTEFHKIASRLRLRPPLTEFEEGIHRFGMFLFQVTLLLTAAIFSINLLYQRPLLDSFLFALALAVGLTPQLLPAIVSVNLAHGAKLMAQKGVIVRRLAAIENFGSMDVLCSDKTGTLTEGRVILKDSLDGLGQVSPKVQRFAALNAHLETGYGNPIDEAIRAQFPLDLNHVKKIDEIPYDFVRKRLSILLEESGHSYMITKGAVNQILSICYKIEMADGTQEDIEPSRPALLSKVESIQECGFRVLAVAYRLWEGGAIISKEEEVDLVLLGFLVFSDPIKAEMPETLSALRRQGISLKVISGDSVGVVRELGKRLYAQTPRILRGPDLNQISDEALLHIAPQTDLFAEIEPNQKERLILALKKAGHVVGYLGDGINDASALHVADVGISVDQAADVAKEAADFVLLKRDLAVLSEGIRYGRTTFANTLKYLFMATSANFGNMLSMAGLSLFLPFLPLLPKQILLNNVLTDLPEMMIAGDHVDEAQLSVPRRWNISVIRKFMIIYGGLSSVFDFLTFGLLILLVPQDIEQFRAAWFIESVSSAALIVLIIRSPLPLRKSRPSWGLIGASLVAVLTAVILPWTPLAPYLGFEPPGAQLLIYILGIIILYGSSAEFLKKTRLRSSFPIQ